MVKSLIVGGIAFGAAFFIERQSRVVGKDIARYDRIRAMSGDPPLVRQGFAMLERWCASMRESRRAETASFLTSLQSDLVRYVRIASM